MRHSVTFQERISGNFERLSPAERDVARFFQGNREEVMVASAQALAARIGTSDATVVRTTRALGYAGMEAMRRDLAAELRVSLAPASRVARTLGDTGADPKSAFDLTIATHQEALEKLRHDVSPALFKAAVDRLAAARRVMVFAIGPSAAIAQYFAFQLNRFGIAAGCLSETGQSLADGLNRLRRGDLLVLLAYTRPTPELEALLDRADQLGMAKILLSDSLGAVLADRIDLSLAVERGGADRISLHTATLALLEALLVGVAAKRPDETMKSLKQLDDLRTRLTDSAARDGVRRSARRMGAGSAFRHRRPRGSAD
jgi:DNA-binding MurR/RpiR family transcriptional regulator